MLSYRVDDLAAVLDGLALAGVRVEMSEEFEDGRFAWVTDPEGNPVELHEARRA
jgi:hypothetical protein